MTTKIVWAAALLLSTAAAAPLFAQTPAPSTATPPTPASPMAASPGTVPETSSGAMSATGTAKVSKADKKFVTTAASGGLAEVAAAQLAQQKSQDPKVKEFAQQMITDHTAANQQLTTLAQQKGIDVPSSPDAKDQKELDKLSKLDEPKFDKMYLKAQVKDHQSMLSLMQKEAKSGKDADLKSFASQTAPTVQKHLDMAKTDSSM